MSLKPTLPLLVALLLAPLAGAVDALAKQTNIIVIYTDNQCYGDMTALNPTAEPRRVVDANEGKATRKAGKINDD